jgi:hypothetical protein
MIKSLFCCCASRHTYDSDEEDGVETTEIVVNVNLCQAGPASDGLTVVEKDKGGVYSASGKGVVIGSCALECDTAYWEVIVGAEPSSVVVGVIRFDPKKEEKPASLSKDKWVLETKEPLKQGDVVGVHWDQVRSTSSCCMQRSPLSRTISRTLCIPHTTPLALSHKYTLIHTHTHIDGSTHAHLRCKW